MGIYAIKPYIDTAKLYSLWASTGGAIIAWMFYLSTQFSSNAKEYDYLTGALCLLFAIFIQTTANYINDLHDIPRGLDENRAPTIEGNIRRSLSISQLKCSCILLSIFTSAIGCSVLIVSHTSFTIKIYLFILGIIIFSGAYFYTGGKKPYGHIGLGELSSSFFFGPACVFGTLFALNAFSSELPFIEKALLSAHAIIFGLIVGLMMLVNNIRDINIDLQHNKKTFAALIGARKAKFIFKVVLMSPLPLLLMRAFVLFCKFTLLYYLMSSIVLTIIIYLCILAKKLCEAIGCDNYQLVFKTLGKYAIIVAIGFGL